MLNDTEFESLYTEIRNSIKDILEKQAIKIDDMQLCVISAHATRLINTSLTANEKR